LISNFGPTVIVHPDPRMCASSILSGYHKGE
jgi:hypothetical protein